MGLFRKSKEPCCICGKEKTDQKIKDGSVCIECLMNYMEYKDKQFTFKDGLPTKSEIKSVLDSKKQNDFLVEKFNVTKEINSFIKFDETNKLIYIETKRKNGKIKKNVYSFEDITGFELLEDGETVTKGGIGSALAGGVLFGGTGAIVGSVVGKKKTKKIIENLQIKLTLKAISEPVAYINLISGKTKTNSIGYERAYEDAQEILSVLSIILKDTENNSNNSNADEILKYKNLLDLGAITEEEFNIKKKELLNL
ncbi:TPA: SHOCT domain-containing protein [Clostridioides difficile]|uniref:SHOCT domain-containing protein n=1 Tax=Clostridioides difficile TaxID=1496 RepID=UPI001C1CFE8E|nr:SHOCT domain-containing protein [Clostridioides difficile]MBY1885390.1 SHOCT domain-containing protein [Clostridioides difficile]MBZ0856675.1 SHOCT domain-containing protein [Clostridioides difficile]MCG7703169.1 SHOCT domain-containing protein [Clostridioides difficile]MCI2341626.1 SHOCT domain-containing protein [Clostridioides difficile]